MGIMDKVKELGDEIVKTVEDSSIKKNVKCATMAIKDTVKDTVEKGRKEIEAKIEESKQKIEEEKRLLNDLEENTEGNVADNFEIGVIAIDTDKMIEFANIFSERICAIKCGITQAKLTFGKYSSEKNVKKILSSWDIPVLSQETEGAVVEDNSTVDIEVIEPQVDLDFEENPIFCYNGGRKGVFLLTDKNFYLKMKHPSENVLYSSKIATEKIQVISVVKEKERNILEINAVKIGLVDNEVAELLDGYLNKVNNKTYEISIDEIIEEVKKVKYVESKVVLEIINDLRN